MTRRARAIVAALVAGIVGLGAVALAGDRLPFANDRPAAVSGAGAPATAGRSPKAKPRLLLLTSLPIVFGERFALQAGSPLLARLERDYEVVPIAAAEPGLLAGHDRLLMAHPRAQPAELLVALDAWVRGGGRVLLLADPKLEWDSAKPLGDLSRPPPYFADTGLLLHWGVRLDATGASQGQLVATGAGCRVESGGLVARCRVGKGEARIVADADFAMDGEAGAGLLMDQLARL